MSCSNCYGELRITAGYEICDDCGYSQTTYVDGSTYTPIQIHREQQIQKDFNGIALPQKIRDDATKIYIDVVSDTTLKRDRRKAMMCKCAYEAFKVNNIARDPIMLTKLFDISIKKLRDAQKDFYSLIHDTEKKESYPKVHLTAKQLLEEFLTLFGLQQEEYENDFNDLKLMIDKLYDSPILMVRNRPRDIAIVVALWQFEKCGYEIANDEVHNRFYIPKVAIVNLRNSIENIG